MDDLTVAHRDRDDDAPIGPDEAADATAVTSGYLAEPGNLTHLKVREFRVDGNSTKVMAVTLLPPGMASYPVLNPSEEEFVLVHARHFWAAQVNRTDDPPFGLVVIPMGCGCDCVADAETWIRHAVCGGTVTLSVAGNTVATCTTTAPPCTPCKFTGLANGTYDVTITATNYTTRVITGYVYTSYSAGDVYLIADLCEESGKHCLGLCSNPGPVAGPLTLTIHEPLNFYQHGYESTGGILDFDIAGPVSITWQASPLPGGLGGAGWWGSTTGSATVGTRIDPCSDACLPFDCDCFTFATEDVDIWLHLLCAVLDPLTGRPEPRYWRIDIWGPSSEACRTSDGYGGCVSPQGFLSGTTVTTPWSPVPVTAPTSAVPGLGNHWACDPLDVDFIQTSVNGVTTTVWATLS